MVSWMWNRQVVVRNVVYGFKIYHMFLFWAQNQSNSGVPPPSEVYHLLCENLWSRGVQDVKNELYSMYTKNARLSI